MSLLRKVIVTVFALPLLWIGFCAQVFAVYSFRYNILSGMFIRDKSIVYGGAFDQPGLFKVAIVLFLAWLFVVLILLLQRMWLGSAHCMLLMMILDIGVLGMLLVQLGLWISYHWYLVRYIYVMGWTFNRMKGMTCGMLVAGGCVALCVYYARRIFEVVLVGVSGMMSICRK